MDRENVVGSWALRRVAHAQIISWVTFALIEGRPRVVAIGERGRLLVRTTMLRKKEGADVRATRPARRRRRRAASSPNSAFSFRHPDRSGRLFLARRCLARRPRSGGAVALCKSTPRNPATSFRFGEWPSIRAKATQEIIRGCATRRSAHDPTTFSRPIFLSCLFLRSAFANRSGCAGQMTNMRRILYTNAISFAAKITS